MVLITYKFQPNGLECSRYAYAIEQSVEDFIDSVQQFDDGDYFVINVIELTYAQYEKWDGVLKGL